MRRLLVGFPQLRKPVVCEARLERLLFFLGLPGEIPSVAKAYDVALCGPSDVWLSRHSSGWSEGRHRLFAGEKLLWRVGSDRGHELHLSLYGFRETI